MRATRRTLSFFAAAGAPMTEQTATPYVYEDRALGSAEPLEVETSPDVFQPTSTTRLLLRAVRRHAVAADRSALDLGCGCGVVALALRRFVLPEGIIGASDLSPAAVQLTRRNARRMGVELDVRCGSLFEPWEGHQFDLVVDDVAAMAETVARSSRWYPPQVPSEAGEDGTRWIVTVLDQASRFLRPSGRLVFPVLSLADQEKTLAAARERFRRVELLEEEWYPLDADLSAHLEMLQDLSARGLIEIRRRGSRWLWSTKVYLAADPKSSPPLTSALAAL